MKLSDLVLKYQQYYFLCDLTNDVLHFMQCVLFEHGSPWNVTWFAFIDSTELPLKFSFSSALVMKAFWFVIRLGNKETRVITARLGQIMNLMVAQFFVSQFARHCN